MSLMMARRVPRLAPLFGNARGLALFSMRSSTSTSGTSLPFLRNLLLSMTNITTTTITTTTSSTKMQILWWRALALPFVRGWGGIVDLRIAQQQQIAEGVVVEASPQPAGGEELINASIYNSSTVKKRHMKMNKHKLRKRRKKMRMNTKVSRG